MSSTPVIVYVKSVSLQKKHNALPSDSTSFTLKLEMLGFNVTTPLSSTNSSPPIVTPMLGHFSLVHQGTLSVKLCKKGSPKAPLLNNIKPINNTTAIPTNTHCVIPFLLFILFFLLC